MEPEVYRMCVKWSGSFQNSKKNNVHRESGNIHPFLYSPLSFSFEFKTERIPMSHYQFINTTGEFKAGWNLLQVLKGENWTNFSIKLFTFTIEYLNQLFIFISQGYLWLSDYVFMYMDDIRFIGLTLLNVKWKVWWHLTKCIRM